MSSLLADFDTSFIMVPIGFLLLILKIVLSILNSCGMSPLFRHLVSLVSLAYITCILVIVSAVYLASRSEEY